MSRSALERREKLAFRSVFDYHELSRHLIETGILSKAQAEKLLKAAAICTHPPDQHVPWQELAPELPHAAYRQLEKLNFKRYTSSIVDHIKSERKDTCKLLIRLQDGLDIETCIMRFGLESEDDDQLVFSSQSRATVCVSSQVGCKMGCTFCATGTMGLAASLTSGEILEQIMMANQVERTFRTNDLVERVPVAPKDGRYIRNVVFMGMGEPLDNYNEVIRSIRCLTNAKIFALAPSRITLSTVGFSIQKIRTLVDDIPKCSLALSLHAPTQELRDELVPTSKGVEIRTLLAACFDFVANQKKLSKTNAKRQCLLVEYCIIAGKNDSDSCAHALGALFEHSIKDVMVNIIPYNSTDVKGNFEAPTEERMESFVKTVRSYGVRVFVRQEHGRDISGACGQLAASKKGKDWVAARSDGAGDDPEDPSGLSEDEDLETPFSSEKLASHFTSVADEEPTTSGPKGEEAEMRSSAPMPKANAAPPDPVEDEGIKLHADPGKQSEPRAVNAGGHSHRVGSSSKEKALYPSTTGEDTLQGFDLGSAAVTADQRSEADRSEVGVPKRDAACSHSPLVRFWKYISGPEETEGATPEDRANAARERFSRRLLIGGGVLLAGSLLVRQILVSFDPPTSSTRRRCR